MQKSNWELTEENNWAVGLANEPNPNDRIDSHEGWEIAEEVINHPSKKWVIESF